MHKLGDTVSFSATATGTNLVYVWEWWDGSTSVTTVPTTTHVANRTGVAHWRVSAVDSLGRSSVYSGTVSVAVPPEFLYVGLSENDDPFPYATHLTAVVIGPNSPVTVGFNGSTSVVISGTGTANFDLLVSAGEVLYLTGTDSLGVVSRLPVELRGVTNSAPVVLAPQISPTTWRIGAGLTGQVVVGASDPDGSALTFEWRLLATNGWASDQILSGVTSSYGSGYSNVLTVNTAGQTPGVKTVVLRVRDSALLTTEVSFVVTLVANSVPVISGISVFDDVIPAGSLVTFAGTASDSDGDSLSYQWAITGPVSGGSLTKSDNFPTVETISPGTVNATLTVYDGVGGVASLASPGVVVV